MPLAELIAQKGHTVSAVAQRMGINRTQVMAWVCGEVPDAHSAIRMAEILGVPLERLYLAIFHTADLMK